MDSVWFERHLTRLEFRSVSRALDRLCGLVVRVSGYRYRGPGFDSRHRQIFLSSSLVSLLRSIEELLE